MISKDSVLHFLKFSSISIIATILEYILFFFLTPILCKIMNQTIADGLSTAICYILATILCYIANRKLIFKSQNSKLKEALKFFAVATPKMLITTFMVPAIILILNTDASIIKTLINVFVQTVLFFAGYILQKIWVFKNSELKTQN